MEESNPTTDELQKRKDDLQKQEDDRQDRQKAQVQQVQQQLQSVTAAAISTKGQIVQLGEVLAEQERERYQLEGMMRALSMR